MHACRARARASWQPYAQPTLTPHPPRLLRESRQRLTIPEADEERWPGYAPAEPPDAPSTSGRDAGCPVFVMLPLDTVWVVERDGKRVSGGVRRMRRHACAGVGAVAATATPDTRQLAAQALRTCMEQALLHKTAHRPCGLWQPAAGKATCRAP